MQPFFSVIIPTYNRASKLQRALESVLLQTYKNFEIFVMDDGSTDNTAEVVASFSDSRITYEWDKNFGGPARPRNRGIVLAKGEWICFLDADDWWTADKLKVCHDCINNQIDLIYHDLEIVSDQPGYFRRKILKSSQFKSSALIDLLIRGNTIPNSSVVVRKSLLDQIGGINESPEMIAAEDYNTWLRIAQLTNGFKYISKRLGFYHLHKQGISSQKDMSVTAQYASNEFTDVLNLKQRKKYLANIKYQNGRFEYLMGNRIAANQSLLISLRYGRISLKIKSAFMLLSDIIFKSKPMSS